MSQKQFISRYLCQTTSRPTPLLLGLTNALSCIPLQFKDLRHGMTSDTGDDYSILTFTMQQDDSRSYDRIYLYFRNYELIMDGQKIGFKSFQVPRSNNEIDFFFDGVQEFSKDHEYKFCQRV